MRRTQGHARPTARTACGSAFLRRDASIAPLGLGSSLALTYDSWSCPLRRVALRSTIHPRRRGVIPGTLDSLAEREESRINNSSQVCHGNATKPNKERDGSYAGVFFFLDGGLVSFVMDECVLGRYVWRRAKDRQGASAGERDQIRQKTIAQDEIKLID